MVDDRRPFSIKGLSLDQLNTLCGFVDAGSLSKLAAGDTSHSRTSLYSRQLKQLEEWFGVALSRKSGRIVVPTESARELALLVREKLHAIEQFREAGRGFPSRLTIAASHSLLAWWVAPRLRDVVGALPSGTRVALLDMRTHEIAAALEARQVDIGLLRENTIPGGMKQALLTRIRYALFVRSAVARGRDAESLLRDLPLAVPLGGRFREQLHAAAAHAGIPIAPAIECSSFSLAAAAVLSTRCGAILPDYAGSAFAGHRVDRMALPFRPEPARSIFAAWPGTGAHRFVSAVRKALAGQTALS